MAMGRLDGGEGDAAPAAELDEVFDGQDGDAKHGRMTRKEQNPPGRRERDLDTQKKSSQCLTGRERERKLR